jgi:hypothetical protein
MRILLLDDGGVVTNWVDGVLADVQSKWPNAIASDTGQIGQRWDGVAFLDVTQPPTAGLEVTAWQLRKAFNLLGFRAAVEAAVAASGDQDLIDGWEYATAYHSDNPLVAAMGAAVGKSAAEVRDIFALAATL